MTDSVALGPGRACPLDYRYGARALAAPATLAADSFWVAGGLYGNTCALERLEELYAQERGNAALVFNGDFHWFDIDDAAFAAIERGVSRHIATRGNVETELAQPRAGVGVSVFASSHTCLPVLQAIEGAGAVVNNGAAGMPNFADSRCGIVTRISVEPGANALYRARIGPLYVEAVPIDYDSGAWLATFLAQWPEGSDAHVSYYGRIVHGPRYCVDQAVRAEPGRNYLAGAPP